MKSKLSWVLIILIALCGGILLGYATRGGIGVESDTASYLGAARNLVNGDGFGFYYPSGRFVFISGWAPLYSLFLAGLVYITSTPIDIVRWINIIFFSIMILTSSGYIYYYSRSVLLAVFFAIIVAFSPLFIRVYSFAMSEPLFYFWVLMAFFSLLIYLHQNKIAFFYLSAICTALALLTRYAAIPLLLTGCMGVLFLSQEAWGKRILKAINYIAISVVGLLVWFLIVWSRTQTIGGRTLTVTATFRQNFNTIKLWFINRFSSWMTGDEKYAWMVDPHHYQVFWTIMIILSIAIFILFYIKIWRKYWKNNEPDPGLREVLLSFCMVLFYCGFLIITYVMTASYGLNDRYFSPIELFTLIFIFSVFHTTGILLKKYKKPYQVILSILLVLWSSVTIFKGVNAVLAYSPDGLGYNTYQARSSKILQVVREMPASIKLISNENPYLFYYSNKIPYLITELQTDKPDWSFTTYGSDPTDPAQVEFRQGRATLILFASALNDFSGLYGDKATIRLERMTEGLYLYYSDKDGSIYFFRQPDFYKGN